MLDIAAAISAFALLEQPGIRLGERLVRRKPGRDHREAGASGGVAPVAGSDLRPELLVVEPAKRAAAGQ